jgi:hypothetical protein
MCSLTATKERKKNNERFKKEAVGCFKMQGADGPFVDRTARNRGENFVQGRRTEKGWETPSARRFDFSEAFLLSELSIVLNCIIIIFIGSNFRIVFFWERSDIGKFPTSLFTTPDATMTSSPFPNSPYHRQPAANNFSAFRTKYFHMFKSAEQLL